MATHSPEPVLVLSRALAQTADVIGEVRPEHLDRPTPCRDWTVADLVDHLVADPGNFVTMMRGGHPDWGAAPPKAGDAPAAAFRSAADALLRTWQEQNDAAMAGADWQTAEFAVHTWDLARGIERPTADLDPEVAQRGLTFMRASLTPGNRGAAFAPERPVLAGASVYEQLAAFSGRDV